MSDYKAFREKSVNENVRLIILRALAEENNATLNDSLLERIVKQFGYTKTRDYIHNQLKWLEESAGAVRLTRVETVVMATLTRSGRYHVERVSYLEGVQRPSDIE